MQLNLLNLLISILTVLILMTPAQAGLVEGIYEGKVEVTDQTSQSRRAALSLAIQQVIVKVTGSEEFLNTSVARDLVRSASQYLTGYSYDIVQQTMLYVANFDEQKINTAIKRGGLPIWEQRRPDTLIWLAYQESSNDFTRHLLEENSTSQFKQVLASTAESRGINLYLPLNDLADLESVSVYDVWNDFIQTLAPASEKYDSDFGLSIRLFPNPVQNENIDTNVEETPYVFLSEEELKRRGLTKQELSWQYFLQEQQLEGSASRNTNLPWKLEWLHFSPHNLNSIRNGELFSETPENALRELVNLIADMMASEFALELTPSDLTATKLKVSGISTLRAYREMIDFMQSLILVERTTLASQQGDTATVEVNLLGSPQDLLSALRLENRVELKGDDSADLDGVLHFRWLGK